MYFYFLVPGIVALIVTLFFLLPLIEGEKTVFQFVSKSIITTTVIFAVWTLFFVAVIRGDSYCTYLGMIEEQAVIKQRASAINLYMDKAVTELQSGSGTIANGNLVITKSSELTDFKYANFQKEIAGMINDLKDEVVSYNSRLVGKRKMYNSPFWNWCVVPPDEDMKLLDIDELFYHGPINN